MTSVPSSPMAVDDEESAETPLPSKDGMQESPQETTLQNMDVSPARRAPTPTEQPEQTSWLLTPPQFHVDDRVFVPVDGVYYEAVIRKARPHDDCWSFLVHYSGWNSRWDEWVPSSQLLSNTLENRNLFLSSQKRARDDSTTAELSNLKSSQLLSETQRQAKRRKTDASQRTNKRRGVASNNNVYQDYCELPFTLKTVLVEELERMTRSGWESAHGYDFECSTAAPYKKPARLVHDLPAAVPVSKLLTHFAKKKIKAIQSTSKEEDEEEQTQNSAKTNSVEKPTVEQVHAFCHELGQLFQEALPVCLLYPEERPQYEAIMNNLKNDENKSLLDIYGCEYLLRLYVRLPLLLQAEQHGDKTTRIVVGPLLTDLLVLMQKNRQALFKSTSYRETAPKEWLAWERQVYGAQPTSKAKATIRTKMVDMDTQDDLHGSEN